MNNNYETIFILNPNTTVEDIEKHVQKVTTIITENQGEIINSERWGLRRLAYLVKKHNKGHYIFLKIKANNKVIDELHRYYRIADAVIKFQTVSEKTYRLKGKKLEKDALQQIKIEVGSDILYHTDELA